MSEGNASVGQGLATGSTAASLQQAAASLPHLSGAGKKKRFMGAPARRGGYITPGGTFRDNGSAEGANISSSRDASEEDNDEASGFSDSASSLRQHGIAANTLLPTTARDKALVDSKEAHRRPSSSNLDHAGAPAMGKSALDGATPELSSNARFVSSLDTSIVSSGPSAQAVGARKDRPPPLGHMPEGITANTAAETPKAVEQQVVAAAVSNPTQHSSRRKGSSPILSHTPAVVEKSSISGGDGPDEKHRSTRPDSDGDDEDDAMDGTAANPYDGDVEFAARTPISHQIVAGAVGAVSSTGPSSNAQSSFAASPALAPALGTATISSGPLVSNNSAAYTAPSDAPSRPFISNEKAASLTKADAVGEGLTIKDKPVPMASPADIRGFIYKAIYEPDPQRTYRINHPADGGKNPARPIRIYADGVYDLFHYAHALQLRQAKLMFPSVHLLVGVVSSSICAAHKNEPVMTSSERYTAVRNCKWVDEVVEDAPWVITQELIDKLNIDYVAHDELPYAGAGSSAEMADVYQFVKNQGRFLPTQRTEGVSTSELLARIVEQYRNHSYDQKLEKIGHKELAFE